MCFTFNQHQQFIISKIACYLMLLNHNFTVWTSHNSCISQILHEINFPIWKYSTNQDSEHPKLPFLTLWNYIPRLISRKICVAVNFEISTLWNSQCGSYRIFMLLRFCVKSRVSKSAILINIERLRILIFMHFLHFLKTENDQSNKMAKRAAILNSSEFGSL